MTEEQIRQIIRDEIIKVLGFSSAIPLSVDQAFRDRFLKNISGVTDEGDGGAVSVSVYNSFDVNVPVVSGKRTLKLEDGSSFDFLYQ